MFLYIYTYNVCARVYSSIYTSLISADGEGLFIVEEKAHRERVYVGEFI